MIKTCRKQLFESQDGVRGRMTQQRSSLWDDFQGKKHIPELTLSVSVIVVTAQTCWIGSRSLPGKLGQLRRRSANSSLP